MSITNWNSEEVRFYKKLYLIDERDMLELKQAVNGSSILVTAYTHLIHMHSSRLSKISHPSSRRSVLWITDLTSSDALFSSSWVDTVSSFSGECNKSAGSGTWSSTILFEDELDEAKIQLVWLEHKDLQRGTRSSNFSFNNLTSWHMTEISPLQKGATIYWVERNSDTRIWVDGGNRKQLAIWSEK